MHRSPEGGREHSGEVLESTYCACWKGRRGEVGQLPLAPQEEEGRRESINFGDWKQASKAGRQFQQRFIVLFPSPFFLLSSYSNFLEESLHFRIPLPSPPPLSPHLSILIPVCSM